MRWWRWRVVVPRFKVVVPEAGIVPWTHGLAYWKLDRAEAVCYPLGVNLIVGGCRWAYFRAKHAWFKTDADTIWLDGFRAGIQTTLRRCEYEQVECSDGAGQTER